MQFVIALTAIARNKVMALRLGTDGYGEFSQLALLAIAVSTFVAFGFGLSLNRNVAAAETQEERQRLLSQANGVILTLAAVLGSIAGVLLLTAPELLRIVGLEPRPTVLVALAILILYIPLEAAVKHRVAFLTALLDIKGLASGRITALMIGTAVSIPIVWYFGLIGAVVQLTLITAGITLMLDRRCRTIGYRPWAVGLDLKTIRFLAYFGIGSLLVGISQQVTDLVIRSFLIRSLGASENGIYQAALSITHQIKAVVLSSVGSYSIATLSQNASRESVVETSNQLLSVVLPVAAVALAGLGLLSAPAVLILYSRDFLPVQGLLPFLFAADFVQVLIWVFNAPLLARNRVRTWVAFEIAFSVARALAALLLIPRFGVSGVAIAYGLATLLHLALIGGYFLFVFRYRVNGKNVLLFAAGFILVAGMSAIGANVVNDIPLYAVGVAVIGVFALACVQALFGLGSAWYALRERVSDEAESE